MASNWVWRHDGTLQCGLGQEETLDEARAALATVIGADAILNAEKRTLPTRFPAVCGTQTGRVNAFELTDAGRELLFGGTVGPICFRPWQDPAVSAQLLAGSEGSYVVALASVPEGKPVRLCGQGDAPDRIEDLIGRRCRVYQVGDPLTEDYWPERINIGLIDGRIAELWFG